MGKFDEHHWGISASAISGSILVVVGARQALVSEDSGETWAVVTHNAQVYSGPPTLAVRPDGSLIGGDSRAGMVISDDRRTFRPATTAEANDVYLGDLFVRRDSGRTEISRDHQHWEAFSPDAVRRLSAG